jgi:membrane-bound metal-dependent hydrolase YbcI (DUF457 family)
MFAGHIGVALAIGRRERRINVGVFVASALLLDFALWLFVLLGWEAVSIPPDYTATHQPEFVFPYTHGLLGALAWSLLAAVAVCLAYSKLGALSAVLIAAAVFSHWILDAIVHRPELPLLGEASATIGLALWNQMTIALLVEAAIVAIGLYLFLPNSGLTRGKSMALVIASLAMLGFTAFGMTLAPPPPSTKAMAMTSFIIVPVVSALYAWLGRAPRERAPA